MFSGSSFAEMDINSSEIQKKLEFSFKTDVLQIYRIKDLIQKPRKMQGYLILFEDKILALEPPL